MGSYFWYSTFILEISLLITGVSSTALDDYVNAADSSYDYTILEDYTRRIDGQYTTYVVNMTSQTWLDKTLVSRSIWWHYLAITIPDNIKYSDVGLLYITGSNNEAAVTGCLFQVPNQPIVFSEDPKNKSRSEDSIIAYTWNHFLTTEGGTNQPEYLALLPMAKLKAGVRALDTMADWAHKIRPEISLTRFAPCGGSKRGWTAWLMGAVDKRVFAMAPIVLDVLNALENLRHHYRSLGGWTWAFNPYYEEDITSQLDNPDAQLIVDIIDPLAYKDRLTMPKYIITASNDEFFLVDDSHYYFDQMIGPTYMRIVANAEHALIGHREDIWNGIASFVVSVLEVTTKYRSYP
ncbi:autocrine proliferation repressor protein A-like [Amphiura filiformis]|uniref:autocrine proliferation repressor protein A-like n=1 Tax=Amphiura filiformis TaxID=82378 RepID=UPI003B22058F